MPEAATESTPVLPPRPTPAQQLWQLWRQGQQPDVGAFLAHAGDLEPAQVAAVLLVDQRERWRSGDRITAETYLQLVPHLREDFEYGLELVFGEFLLAEERGEAPNLEDYRRRFPLYAERLKLQVELHHALARVTGSMPWGADLLTLTGGGRPATEEPAAWPSVPGYEILAELGRGGMSVVY